ncbi:hypothetical protein MTR67_007494 [Solanum verrucosum]|uniref:Alpha N-terminal protein methyltransferase 1 n=1 Tax=Solanum verrucosum TaxID=315347 RepID=A0AAF0TD57_SOLVR|nr:hypothetical protein MTR67_007494 [Solanum verrucosum]
MFTCFLVGLKPGGFFVLKENIARTGFVLDKEDKSITRSDSYFKELFKQCGLHIYKMKDQKEFPDELFAVKMYALTTEMPGQVMLRVVKPADCEGHTRSEMARARCGREIFCLCNLLIGMSVSG